MHMLVHGHCQRHMLVHGHRLDVLGYGDVRCAAIHSHRLGVLGYGDVRCAAIHSHRRPLEMGFAGKMLVLVHMLVHGHRRPLSEAHTRPRP